MATRFGKVRKLLPGGRKGAAASEAVPAAVVPAPAKVAPAPAPAAARGNGLSRIYVGWHFRKAVDDGIRHGRRIRRVRGRELHEAAPPLSSTSLPTLNEAPAGASFMSAGGGDGGN